MPLIEGIDIYEHNDIYFNIVKLGFISIKASEGYYSDPMFFPRMRAAQEIGIPRMPYHMLYTNLDVQRQADEYISKFAASGWEIPPAIDWEFHNEVNWLTQVKRTQAFAARIRNEIGTYPHIYTGRWFIMDLYQYRTPAEITELEKQLSFFVNYPLWLADYSYKLLRTREQMLADPPPVRIPFPWKEWTILQWTDHGTIVGSPGSADINVAKDSIIYHSTPLPQPATTEERLTAIEERLSRIELKLGL